MSIQPESDSAVPDLDRLDAFCDRFENAWIAGERPSLAAILAEAGSAERPLLFSYLLEIDLDYRIRAGETPRVDDYAGDFPNYRPVIQRQIHAAETSSQAGAATVDVTPSPSNAGRRLRKGAMLGGYELLEELGRGGMGVVFKARQIALDRIVALKTIKHVDEADEQLIRRFQAEAEVAAKLSHDGIVPIFDVGEADEIHFFSMQLVDGQSLAQMVADGPLPVKQAAEITRDVALAMQFAHDHGLVHRDLKPANVLMDGGLRPKITDFGVAKLVRGDSNLTMTGQILGTPGYMPPEQATGDSQQVDSVSDVYSIGATLYQLLTGSPPFRGASPIETIRQVTEKEPVSPRQMNPSVSVDLETICLKCLQKERHRRYPSAAELAADLERWLSGQPILARPIGPAGRLIRWCRRQPVVAGLIAAVAVSLLVGTIVSANYAVEADLRAQEAERKEKEATRLKGEALTAKQAADNARAAEETQRRLTEQELYWTTIQLAADRLATGRGGEVATMLWNTKQELRGWEWGWLMSQCRHPRWVIEAHEGSLLGLSVTADGSRLATIGTDADCALWDVATQQLLWRVSSARRFDQVAIDPLGRFVAVSRAGVIEVRRTADSELQKEIKVEDVHLIAISPTGDTLYSCRQGVKDSRTHPLTAWNTSDWSVKAQVDNKGSAGAVTADMAGKFVVVGTGNYPSKTFIYRADTLELVESIDMYWEIKSQVLDSERGRLASSLRNDLQMFQWRNDDLDANRLDRADVSETVVVGVAYHRPLDRFLAAALDGTVTVHRPDASVAGKLHHGESFPRLAPLGDSQLLTGGRDGLVKCWELATVLDHRKFAGFVNPYMNGASNIALNTDGTLAAYCGYSESYEKFHVANLRSGRQDMYVQPISQKQMRFGQFIPGTSQFCFVVPGEIRIHDAAVRPWKLIRTIPCADDRQLSIDIDAKGTRLLLAYRNQGVDCFDLADGSALPKVELTSNGVSQIRADGKIAIMQRRSNDGADVWNVDTGSLIAKLAPGEECKSATLHPTEPIAALGTRDGDVLIWDFEQQAELTRFSGHDFWITTLRFAPDGRRLFTASQDHTVQVWNWRQKKRYLTLPHNNAVFGLAISADGKTIASTATGPHAHIREVPDWNVARNEQRFLDQVHDLRVRDQARLMLIELAGKNRDYQAMRAAVEAKTGIAGEVKSLALELVEDWRD